MPDPEARIEPTAGKTPEPKAPEPEVKTEAKTEGEAKTEVKPEPKPEPPKKDWRDSRIAELTAKLNEERAKTVEPPKQPAESEADFEARVQARAAVLADETVKLNDWNARCTEVFTSGKAEFPDFAEKLSAVKSVVNPRDQNEVLQYNEVLAAAIETGRAPALLHALGSDPGRFQELMKLSPVKRGMELAKMVVGMEARPEPSGLPAPITPINGGAGPKHEEIRPDDPSRGMKLSTAEWMRRREKQASERGLQ